MNNLTEKNKNTDERFIDLPNRLITYQCNNCKEYVIFPIHIYIYKLLLYYNVCYYIYISRKCRIF